MISTNDVYAPNQSTGCLWATAKVLLLLVAVLIFTIGFFVGLFLTAISSFLM